MKPEGGKKKEVMKMKKRDRKDIVNEIVERIKKVNPLRVIIFGSYAKGNTHKDSDIDVLVVLNKKGFSKDYEEILENKRLVSKNLSDLRKIIPIDLLVYTKDEWEYLKNSGSLFFKEIEKRGLKII